MPVPDDLIELGSLRGAYGVRGWVKVAPLSPDADTLRAVSAWWLQAGGDGAPRPTGPHCRAAAVDGSGRAQFHDRSQSTRTTRTGRSPPAAPIAGPRCDSMPST